MFDWARALVAAGMLVTLVAASEARATVFGDLTEIQPTTGAMLQVGPDLKSQFLDCSGVLIGCRTVLTAAHCVCRDAANYAECVAALPDLDTADLRFFFQHSGFHHVREIFINPSFVAGRGGDLAVMRVSERVDGIEPAVIHTGFPSNIPNGTEGVIAGFGNSGDEQLDAAIKRVGNVTTGKCLLGTGVTEPANICWNYESPVGSEADLCLLDEGGPLFIDFGDGPVVAGIHAGNGSSCDEDAFTYATNVEHSHDWIKSVGGLDVLRDQCSDLGEVGQLWVKVSKAQGKLPKNQDEARFSFAVPEDSLVLRVTVNGDTAAGGDYDLFVGLDDKAPTRFDNDCQRRGVGQFGACEFEEPGVTNVNVLIRHVRPGEGRGRSRFQVTVTAFEPPPPPDNAPEAPQNLHYTKRDTDLRTLLWDDESHNELGFELQRRPGTSPTADFTTRATLKANSTRYLENIQDDTVFTYRLRAFNAFGRSDWSNLCVVNKPRFPRPGNLHTEEVLADSVSLKWRDKSDGESKFEVQRRLAGALQWKTIKTLPADTVTYVDETVDPNKTYEYRVRARGFLDQCIKHSNFSLVLEVTTP